MRDCRSGGEARFDHSGGPPRSSVEQRWDLNPLRAPIVREDGFLSVEAIVTRTGVFKYTRKDGSIQRELRRPEEVFRRETLDSFGLVPLTLNHPPEPEGVTPATYAKYSVGAAGRPEQLGTFAKAQLLITRQDAIDEVMAGKRQTSYGYKTTLLHRSGTWRYDDGTEEPFDVEQTLILGNHLAIVDSARAGPAASIRLDDSGAYAEHEDTESQLEEQEITIGGKTYKIAKVAAERMRTDGLLDPQFKEIRKDAAPTADPELGRLKAENDQLRGQQAMTEAQKKKDAEEAAAKARKDAASSGIKTHIATIAKARGLGLDKTIDDLSAMSEPEIMRAALAKAHPELKLDGWSDDTVRGAFATASVRVDTAGEISRLVDGTKKSTETKADEAPDPEVARQKMIDENRKRWQS